jgi:mannose-1-phosphate guanylyltransferase/phosphomannomutase
MAGGEGTRLRPLTSSQPKPMLPVANRPLLEHVIGLLRRHGFSDLVVTLAFRAEAVRAYFDDGADLGVHITYATEEHPLGTAGSVRHAMGDADEPFLVISGDVLTDVDLSALVGFHRDRPAAEVTVAVQPRDDPLDFGIVITGPDGRVQRFLEKPTRGRVFSDTVNTGIYVLDPSIFDAIPAGRPVDFSGEVFPTLLDAGRGVFGCVVDGYWEDVGTLDAYLRVHRDLLDGRVDAGIPGFSIGAGVWLGEGAELDPSARVKGPAVIGPSCRVEAGAEIGAYTVLGSNVRVGPEVSIERSVVHDNVYFGPGAHLRGSVVGRSGRVRRGARLEEGTVLGDDCVIGEEAVINPGVAVYPSKTVDPGATVNSSIIWESRGARTLFGAAGVTGLANVDVTPELAVRLAMAYATTLPRGARVVVSRDTSRAGRVLKRAIMVGLNAAGLDVVDLEVATVPVTRFAVRAADCEGAITVRLLPGDAQSVILRFFERSGIDLSASARKPVERIFARQDVRRSLAGEIGDIILPGRVAEDYTIALTGDGGEGLVDLGAVRAARAKVVLDYSYGAASFVMPNVLAKLGADVLSVNPYASTRQALAFDRFEHAEEVARLVLASGAELGAVIDSDGEHITFVDDRGHVLTDAESLAVVVELVLGAATAAGGPAPAVALPVSATRAAEDIVRRHGARLELTGLSAADVLDAAVRSNAVVAAGAHGGYAFPSFLPAFDAVATFVVVLGLLAAGTRSLSDLRLAHPVGHVAHEAVPTPWERTGAVMRTLLESCHDRELVLVEGVKALYPDGWVLVTPDADAPSTHVWAEAADDETVAARVAEFAGRVRAAAGGEDPPPAQGDSGMFGA